MALSDFLWRAPDTHHPDITCDARFDNLPHEFVISARRADGRVAMSRIKAAYNPLYSGVDHYDLLAIKVEAGKLADQLADASPVEKSA